MEVMMQQEQLDDFIHERATHLAIVHLTRNPDLMIERMSTASVIDMMISIRRDQRPTGRIFGIQIKGQDKAFKNIQPEAPSPLTQAEKSYFQDLPFPVCTFYFSMADDRGYYKWLQSPQESSQSIQLLELHQWHSLDEHAIDQVVADVNAWYNQKNPSAA
jgi:Domain of unknown function (DUF4365)